jgi:hypothetical protein
MSDYPETDDARDDFILQERLSGRSARSISKELRCTVGEVDASLDRTLPKITNDAKRRLIALDLDRLDGLIEVFYKRAIEKVDAQAGLLVVKIRKAALLGLDSPQKVDVVQVQAVKEPSRHEKIREAIKRITDQQPPAEREAINLISKIGGERALELLKAGSANGNGAVPSAISMIAITLVLTWEL